MGNKHGCCVYPGGRGSRASHQKVCRKGKLCGVLKTLRSYSDSNNSVLNSSSNFDSSANNLCDRTDSNNHFLNTSYKPSDHELNSTGQCYDQSTSSKPSTKSHRYSLNAYPMSTSYFPCSSSFLEHSSIDGGLCSSCNKSNSSWCEKSCVSLPSSARRTALQCQCQTQSEILYQHPYCETSSHHPNTLSQQNNKVKLGDLREKDDKRVDDATPNLQHISEREPDDLDRDPSLHPTAGPLFLYKSKQVIENGMLSRKRSRSYLDDSLTLKKSSSCSTIYLDDSTVSQPNLKNTMKCVALAIYYLIKFRSANRIVDIFDEKLHPLTKDSVHTGYDVHDPEQRHIYRFVRTLFTAAQLTAECAIITLVYLERLLTYADIDMTPGTWKRIVLGAIILASKVWDDQAVWNVDYCQILRDISVDDMNELERNYLELVQFNINVPSSVYTKYYFALRTLAEANDLAFPTEPLSTDRALRLEAMSRVCENKYARREVPRFGRRRWTSLDDLSMASRRPVAILS